MREIVERVGGVRRLHLVEEGPQHRLGNDAASPRRPSPTGASHEECSHGDPDFLALVEGIEIWGGEGLDDGCRQGAESANLPGYLIAGLRSAVQLARGFGLHV